MEPSPLTQVSRPETFQPKIVQLYEALFQSPDPALDDHDDHEHSEGFWQEFFLLKPDPPSLRRVLQSLSADAMLHLQVPAQQLFSRAIDRVQDAKAPSDEIALDTLTVFLGAVLSKKYTNPSSDILSVLAGLDDADAVLSELVAALDNIIRSGRNRAYTTGLISYFTHRDLFPSLMKFVQDSESSVEISEPFILLGLLANYNKFEFQNPYRLRLDDFVNDVAIKKTVQCVGNTCRDLRDKYVSVQDDTPEAWSIGTALSYVGLGALTGSRPASPAPTPEEAQSLFTTLPGPEAAILLSAYDFANANKLFCFNLINLPAASKTDITPFSAYLSLTSYLFQHAHPYHWSELWRSLLSFIRFLTTYANDIKSLRESPRLIDDTVNLIALSLSAGESFLPDAAAYDDLFYKLVETGDILTKFRDAYDLSKQSSSSSIETLISVSSHYHSLLEGDEKGKVKSKNLSPREVSKVIKQGYETLSIQAREDLDHWERYREADHKVILKKVSRAAVEDSKALVAEK
ncbi:hypothetical protein GTA08_BOTSDO07757 [Neofusicoccum parvum]|uniref:Armadillo-like helical domain-containing protein n=1 Tax=Botryosphaeria parva (strain UCR-NP2) TaxID=1287680 RepID=R1GS59_BOTPV|nr:hypothetical protein UCRNP2_4362 [Neofusicoccum parvum UCRNP2]GME50012.1 hypothetical protein GTA08_BOTSDO07757 [Neofusicoccum parvum]